MQSCIGKMTIKQMTGVDITVKWNLKQNIIHQSSSINLVQKLQER